MHFCLLDRVLERSDDRIVTIKQVSAAEEYLQDHFPDFPVLPGVFMVEALVQAARELVNARAGQRLVLGSVKALKYGSFVRPGQSLRAEVVLLKTLEDGTCEFKGTGTVIDPACVEGSGAPQSAVSGRFVLRPVRIERPAAAG
jgi:3-hydroxyacyl-[acyl-carrier-protein] dehydratase